MNGYGAMLEGYCQGETDILGGKHYIVWVVGVDGYGAMVEWF